MVETARQGRGTGGKPRATARAVGPTLNVRIDFGRERALGPGKVRLIELIAELGSISAAGRAMGMSYRRAWLLVASLNAAFREPLVVRRAGGSGGGGATVTKQGLDVVKRYRRIEQRARAAGIRDLGALATALHRPRS
jgi:molybdate transport system regulatory protein